MKRSLPLPFSIAPGLLGAFFLLLGWTAALTGCRSKPERTDWEGNAPPPAAAAPAKTPLPAATKPPEAPAGAATAGEGAAATATSPEGIRFVAYNVENWLTMDRTVNNRSVKGAPKPEKERKAVIDLLVKSKPDIAGLCELGGEADLREIQAMLAAAGHPLEHLQFTGGSDPTRHVGLLSRYPVLATKVHTGLNYSLQGKGYGMQRGILDVTLDTPAGPLRFLGVHLKSKRETEEGDQEEMRRNEAHLLRREIDAILHEDPATKLVVYGDMNDTRQSPTIRTIHGTLKDPTGLMMIALKDSRGEYWTQHWSYQDVYSRIDYVMLSKAMQDVVSWDDCRVIDDPEWSAGSDHRPLFVLFKKR